MTTFVKRSYSGGAKALTLINSINATTTSFTATGTFTTWPTGTTGPFFITVDKGLTTEEKMTVSTFVHATGTFTVTRGADGTPAVGHVPVTNQILLTWSATEAQQANRVVHTVNTIQSATATTVPIVHTSGGTKVFQYTNPGVQFGLNTTASKILGPGSAASAGPSTTTTGAKAKHVHKLVTHTGAAEGSVPSTPAWLFQAVTKTITTNGTGTVTITYPSTFPHAVLGVWLTQHAPNNAGYFFIAKTVTLTKVIMKVYLHTGTSTANTVTFNLVQVLVLGC